MRAWQLEEEGVEFESVTNYEEVKGEIRGSTSEKKSRLCVKTTDKAVDDDDDETWGVCNVMVSRGVPCRGDWKPLVVGGIMVDPCGHHHVSSGTTKNIQHTSPKQPITRFINTPSGRPESTLYSCCRSAYA